MYKITTNLNEHETPTIFDEASSAVSFQIKSLNLLEKCLTKLV